MDFVQKVKKEAEGRWLEILPALDGNLKDAVSNIGRHVADPVRGGKDGFRLFEDAALTGAGVSNPSQFFNNGLDLLSYSLNLPFKEVLHLVDNYINGTQINHSTLNTASKIVSSKPVKRVDPKVLLKRRESLRKIWQMAIKLDNPKARIARQYLSNRGLDISIFNLESMSKTIRFVPSLALWHDNVRVGFFPALVSLTSYADGKPATIHRTYLSKNGEKLRLTNGVPTKKIMSPCTEKSISGGAIRIDSGFALDEKTIHIAEGIETALSVSSIIKKNVWATASANLMGNFQPKESIRRIFVWADKDRTIILPCGKKHNAGLDSALKLAERMEKTGIDVFIMMPKLEIPDNSKGVDWNDVLIQQGVKGFPSLSIYTYY